MKLQSHYLSFFKGKEFTKLLKGCTKKFLSKDEENPLLFVEKLSEPEYKTKSGLVLVDGESRLNHVAHAKTKYCVVLFYHPETQPNVQIGDVVAVAHFAGVFFARFGTPGYQPGELGVIRQSDILINLGQIESLSWVSKIKREE